MTNIDLIKTYYKAVQAVDLAQLGALVATDVVWHQPGENQFSGTHTGAESVFAMLGGMIEASGGTFKIDQVKEVMANGAEVAATITFSGQRNSSAMAMSGVDVFTVNNGKITEVWLYSSDQAAEDEFWGAA
jgi:ketosteroid isomerase-like protein|tara:strand:- start:614 stop:1006 length:393 start_codon:yes stop_codon:yes gene_type:complete